jgi:hypothetical protein
LIWTFAHPSRIITIARVVAFRFAKVALWPQRPTPQPSFFLFDFFARFLRKVLYTMYIVAPQQLPSPAGISPTAYVPQSKIPKGLEQWKHWKQLAPKPSFP